ncbi:MAG: hypothetical protein CME38_17795 [Haliea sp.]|nr:hypothetical protein [Haliea sp.]
MLSSQPPPALPAAGLLERCGVHESRIREIFTRFDYRNDFPPVQEPVCALLFTNRSGSTLVAEYLRATGRVMAMGEPLNHPIVARRAEKFQLTGFPEYMAHEYRRWRKPGAIYGLKASWDQALMLWRAGIVPGYFQDVRWVRVRRRDLLGQAISFTIAEQTQRWHSFDVGERPPPQYDFLRILRRVQSLGQANGALDALCATLDLQPYEIDHDAFVAEPEAGTRRLARHLGLGEVQIDPEALRMNRQRGSLNREFRERFLRDYRAQVGRASDPNSP